MRIDRHVHADSRGHFSRLFCEEELAACGWDTPVRQINETMTHEQGAVRGMHFQHPPAAEDKLVTCLSGEIFDVAVDMRRGSPTFLNWHGEILSAQNKRSLLIPKGFAHGFQALSSDCQLVYLHSAPFDSESEGACIPSTLHWRSNGHYPLPSYHRVMLRTR
ncbi:dTDP-4-dehydrorhamnose 3,5-epimerase family protein [Parasphingorhabdus halotolerans]|uniref:dTDP-4-dehydrorhamnose 3,5-epimerase family protein n=1 Tax=Parasphingorhabdus halotolerans TaxID=2725558 RepID=UPI001B39D191|nr:dTDP-4-dehydrorhamnose 3,5-epimerase [Parasphingorhabdus halotolerans]